MSAVVSSLSNSPPLVLPTEGVRSGTLIQTGVDLVTSLAISIFSKIKAFTAPMNGYKVVIGTFIVGALGIYLFQKYYFKGDRSSSSQNNDTANRQALPPSLASAVAGRSTLPKSVSLDGYNDSQKNADFPEKIGTLSETIKEPKREKAPSKTDVVRKLQRIWRATSKAKKARQNVAALARKHLLSDTLLEQAKLYVDDPLSLQEVPRASDGKTPVYLPKELSVVLKQSGFPENQKRFEQMREAREICEENHYQHLVIPQARVYKNFIVESRLPLGMFGTKEQIGLYIENQKRFDDAVKEFTGFLCQSSLTDITGNTYNPYDTLSTTPMGRYDNIALYLEGTQGKIGLVDLEKFVPYVRDKPCFQEIEEQDEWCFSRCQHIVRLFPYHLKEIMDVAKTFAPGIEQYGEELNAERVGALTRFALAYENHLAFITEKGITLETPTKWDRPKEDRFEEIKKVVGKKILEKHSECYYTVVFSDNPNQSLIDFNEKIFPQILEAIYTSLEKALINGHATVKMKRHQAAILSIPVLLSIRTVQIDAVIFYDELIKQHPSLLEGILTLENGRVRYVIEELLDVILKELERGKEIAYYNPEFGKYSNKRCVFF